MKNKSIETIDIVREMMKTSKLSKGQERYLENYLLSSQTLPLKISRSKYQSTKRESIEIDMKESVERPARKSLEAIKASGIYERPKYNPVPMRNNEKLKLSFIEYLEDLVEKPAVIERKEKRLDMAEMLREEIRERLEFIREMKDLGALKPSTLKDVEYQIKIRSKQLNDLSQKALTSKSLSQ